METKSYTEEEINKIINETEIVIVDGHYAIVKFKEENE